MKSRSEVMKTRSQAAAEKKTSAAERTKPMFDENAVAPTDVKCEACEEISKIKDLERRDDGTLECPHCAAPMVADKPSKLESKKPPREPGDDTDEIEKELEEERKQKAKDAPKNTSSSGSYCGDCGAEWPLLKGEVLRNCGHKKALEVDDPRKAKNMRDVTASGITKVPDGPVQKNDHPTGPSFALNGRRISLTWGEATFPIAQYSSMKVGNFIMSRELQEGEDPLEVATRMLADLQKIADTSFDTQFAWYRKKLGLIER